MDEGTGKSASKKVINFTKTSKKWPWESKLGELHAQRTSPNYWAACAPSHKMGFRSSAAKNGLPGEEDTRVWYRETMFSQMVS